MAATLVGQLMDTPRKECEQTWFWPIYPDVFFATTLPHTLPQTLLPSWHLLSLQSPCPFLRQLSFVHTPALSCSPFWLSHIMLTTVDHRWALGP